MGNENKLILVSFNHPVGVMLDGRAILVGCAICKELYRAEASVVRKEEKPKKSSGEPSMHDAEKLTLDFPLFLHILALGDGKPLAQPIEILVKWNNISAICTL